MVRQKYFICAEISYSFLRQRHQILAEKLSFSFGVLFIERIPSRFPYNILQRTLRIRNYFDKGNENGKLEYPSNIKICKSYLLPEINFIFRLYNKLRVKYILRNAKKDDIVHLFSNTPSLAIEAKTKDCLLIFDIVHNWWSFPYHNAIQNENLKKVIQLCDIIISDSSETLNLARAEVNGCHKKLLLMHPGVDKVWIKAAQTEKQLDKSHYNIAFFGNLRINSDLNIFKKLTEKADTKVMLYGLLDQSLGAESKWLQQHYQGKYEVEELVPLLSEADALLLPYDKSEFSRTIFPAKYFEAMALGLPIISDSKMLHLPSWTELVWTYDQLASLGWKELLTQHYKHRSKLQIELASKNTWTERVNSLVGLINETL